MPQAAPEPAPVVVPEPVPEVAPEVAPEAAPEVAPEAEPELAPAAEWEENSLHLSPFNFASWYLFNPRLDYLSLFIT